jgi:hypothetical protein
MTNKSIIVSYDCAIYVAPRIVGKNEGFGPAVRHGTLSKSGDVTNSVSFTPDSIPNWKQRIRQHSSATTSLSGSRYEIQVPSGGRLQWEAFSKLNGNRSNGTLVTGGLSTPTSVEALPAVPSMSHVNNQALTDFVSKAYSARASLQALVTGGELGETLRMIATPLKSLRKGLDDYLKAAERNARKAARRRRPTRPGRLEPISKGQAIQRSLAGTYLEHAFGWRPFVNEIDSAAKAAARIVIYRPPTQFVKGQSAASGWTAPTVYQPNTGVAFLRNVYENRYDYRCKLYGVMINRSGWNGAFSDLGLTPRDFIPSIYQLIPYSFVVDYFTNFGTVLEAAALNKADIAWVNIGTQKIQSKQTASCDPLYPSVPPHLTRTEHSFSPGRLFAITLTTVTRAPYIGSLIPSLQFTIPGLGTKWINMGALIAQSRATSRRIARL